MFARTAAARPRDRAQLTLLLIALSNGVASGVGCDRSAAEPGIGTERSAATSDPNAGAESAHGPSHPDRREAPTTSSIVSVVNGQPIAADEALVVAREARISPRLALERLEEESVLAQLAAAANLDAEDAARKAAVQALLHDRIESITVSAESIERALNESADRFRGPERRDVAHLLIPAANTAPRDPSHERGATSVDLERVIGAVNPIAEAQRLASEDPTLVFEDLPPIARRSSIDAAFIDAVFSAPGPGVIPYLVETPFGTHIVILQRILPAWRAPESEARSVVENELREQAEARALDALVDEIRARTPITLHDEGLGILSDQELGTGSR